MYIISKPVFVIMTIKKNCVDFYFMSDFSDLWDESHSSTKNENSSLFKNGNTKCVEESSALNQTFELELHTCSYCGKQVQASYLKRHIRLHVEGKPFKCSVCKKSFSHRGNLNQHYRIHTGEKPYVCQICSKAFTQKSNLQMHMKKHLFEKLIKK